MPVLEQLNFLYQSKQVGAVAEIRKSVDTENSHTSMCRVNCNIMTFLEDL